MFSLSSEPIERNRLTESLANHGAGAIVVFEGWVRDLNEGKEVTGLEYQVYPELAHKEGEKILAEATQKFNLKSIKAIHRYGHLNLGEIAVWIGATAAHRDDAFKATRFVIDEMKHRLPVWKKEHYVNKKPEWVFCKHHHNHVHFKESEYYEKQSSVVFQSDLKKASVLVVGAGGLGCPALIGLTQAGIGKIGIVDSDRIHISNIHRQSLYTPNLAGEKKVKVARSRLCEINPFIKIKAIDERIDSKNALNILIGYDLVLDCTDNMETKYLLLDSCFKLRVPLISASVFKHEGQIRTFKPGSEYGCLRCYVSETPQDHLLGNCDDLGVLGVTTNIIGNIQASEAVTFIQFGTCNTLTHTLFLNLKNLSQLKIKNTGSVSCNTCEGHADLPVNDLEVDHRTLQKEGVYFLDIRELADHELEKFKNYVQPVVLCCYRGVRSKELVKSLRAQGHSHFYSLKGGACSL